MNTHVIELEMTEGLTDIIKQAKAKGLRVFVPVKTTLNDPICYCYFTDGKNVGYGQAPKGEGISFSTVHVPNRQTGTGYKVDSMEEALGFCPSWASNSDKASVIKFPSWESFAKKHWQPLKEV